MTSANRVENKNTVESTTAGVSSPVSAPAPRTMTAVMLAFGPEPYLAEAVSAVLNSTDVVIDLVLVDNGTSSPALAGFADDPRITLLHPANNLGFTGGVNLGMSAATGDVVVMVNSDAVVEADAFALLWDRVQDPEVGIAGSAILLADRPELLNSAGNPLHILGLCWAGGMNERYDSYPFPSRGVASASGASMAMRRQVWQEFGGFPDMYFAYHEDLELSWRCWQRGLRVELVPESRALHYYEFSRSSLKMYLLERNRLLFVLTTYSRRLLFLLAPALLAFELAIFLVSVFQGWAGQKAKGWGWILTHSGQIWRRRAQVQRARTVRDRDLTWLLTDAFDSAQMPLPAAATSLQGLLRLYWAGVRKLL